ncbi:MAG: hypothetical protein UU47_C0008G0021 [candidate division TM6 bacterium GW2011_GWE2_41_16]|nr:MAG: hypothetical protein UU47_C0008G0021 [candidate division TM6 bacterium GW2011_GWE2_41_16]
MCLVFGGHYKTSHTTRRSPKSSGFFFASFHTQSTNTYFIFIYPHHFVPNVYDTIDSSRIAFDYAMVASFTVHTKKGSDMNQKSLLIIVFIVFCPIGSKMHTIDAQRALKIFNQNLVSLYAHMEYVPPVHPIQIHEPLTTAQQTALAEFKIQQDKLTTTPPADLFKSYWDSKNSELKKKAIIAEITSRFKKNKLPNDANFEYTLLDLKKHSPWTNFVDKGYGYNRTITIQTPYTIPFDLYQKASALMAAETQDVPQDISCQKLLDTFFAALATNFEAENPNHLDTTELKYLDTTKEDRAYIFDESKKPHQDERFKYLKKFVLERLSKALESGEKEIDADILKYEPYDDFDDVLQHPEFFTSIDQARIEKMNALRTVAIDYTTLNNLTRTVLTQTIIFGTSTFVVSLDETFLKNLTQALASLENTVQKNERFLSPQNKTVIEAKINATRLLILDIQLSHTRFSLYVHKITRETTNNLHTKTRPELEGTMALLKKLQTAWSKIFATTSDQTRLETIKKTIKNIEDRIIQIQTPATTPTTLFPPTIKTLAQQISDIQSEALKAKNNFDWTKILTKIKSLDFTLDPILQEQANRIFLEYFSKTENDLRVYTANWNGDILASGSVVPIEQLTPLKEDLITDITAMESMLNQLPTFMPKTWPQYYIDQAKIYLNGTIIPAIDRKIGVSQQQTPTDPTIGTTQNPTPHLITLGLTPADIAGKSNTDIATLIKRLYRKLAIQKHPDKHPDNRKAATQEFQDLGIAYDALKKIYGF